MNARIPDQAPDEILTVSEIAERLRLAPSWVYAHAGLLGAYRLGKYLRFSWQRALDRLEHCSNCDTLGSQPNDLPESP
jgi:hypothetical protein